MAMAMAMALAMALALAMDLAHCTNQLLNSTTSSPPKSSNHLTS
jgi:hypothetical protein